MIIKKEDFDKLIATMIEISDIHNGAELINLSEMNFPNRHYEFESFPDKWFIEPSRDPEVSLKIMEWLDVSTANAANSWRTNNYLNTHHMYGDSKGYSSGCVERPKQKSLINLDNFLYLIKKS